MVVNPAQECTMSLSSRTQQLLAVALVGDQAAASEIAGGPAGSSVPVGGTNGQVLAKASSTNFDTHWIVASVNYDAFSNLFIGTGVGANNAPAGVFNPPTTYPSAGYDNIAIGGPSEDGNGVTLPALASNTTGECNMAIGSSALSKSTTGSYNLAIGGMSLANLTAGGNNFAIGYYDLSALTNGNQNLSIGGSLGNLTSGNSNIALNSAGSGLVSGNSNIFLGTNSRTTKPDLNNGIAIGSGTYVYNNNQCILGTGCSVAFSGATAPADGDIQNGQLFLYVDPTNGAGKLLIKGKTANGTVVNGSVALA